MTRKLALVDNIPPYLWEDDELIFCLNRAFNELIKIPLIKDQTTTAIVQVPLLSNLGVYAMDSRILQVASARFSVNTSYGPLNKTTELRLDQTVSNWRNQTGTPREFCPGAYNGYLTIYPKFDEVGEYIGASNISFASGVNVISQSGGDFSILEAGDQVVVTDSGVAANNTTLTVATVGTDSFTVSESITTATNTSAIIRMVRDTLLLSVTRLGTARFVVSDITDGEEIGELRDDQAEGLIDGIAKRAFLKPTTQTLDPNKAESHRQQFELFKKDMRRDLILLNKPERTRVLRSGTSIGY